jgi:hypothetical protein
MIESSGKNFEQPGGQGDVAGKSLEQIHSIGGASSEITSPAHADDAPPDPVYGDVLPHEPVPLLPLSERPSQTDSIVPDYANPQSGALPAEQTRPLAYTQNRPVAGRERKVESFPFQVVINGVPKHQLIMESPWPETEYEQSVLVQRYIEAVRNRGPYPGELDMNEQERAILSRYTGAQRRVARQLDVVGSVEYDITHTPYHVLPDKAAVDAIVLQDMDVTWTTPTGGTYTPITGALWPRYVDAHQARIEAQALHGTNKGLTQAPQARQITGHNAAGNTVARRGDAPLAQQRNQLAVPSIDLSRAERGLARLVVESSATFVGFPDKKSLAHSRAHGLSVLWGVGYKRPDLLPDMNKAGLHRATTEMAMQRVLRAGGFKGELKWQSFGLNAVLDGVIRGAAHRLHESPRKVGDDFLAGYYDGNTTAYHRVLGALPRGSAYVLQRLTGSERTREIAYISDVLNVPLIYNHYQALRRGERPPLYKW